MARIWGTTFAEELRGAGCIESWDKGDDTITLGANSLKPL